jgi:hypothetical protein
MSRGNGSYHGKFTEDYTDYDIDYYSSMSKVSKEYYINKSFDYGKHALAHQDT